MFIIDVRSPFYILLLSANCSASVNWFHAMLASADDIGSTSSHTGDEYSMENMVGNYMGSLLGDIKYEGYAVVYTIWAILEITVTI